MNSYLLQERFSCYCFMPNLVWVESEYSDVQNRLENHWYLEKSLVLFGSHMDQLLSRTDILIARAIMRIWIFWSTTIMNTSLHSFRS